MKPLIGALTVLLCATVVSCTSRPVTEARPAASPQGTWKEFWSPDEPTDVVGNDLYTVELPPDGGYPVVTLLRTGQTMEEPRYAGGVLMFTQRTSFPITYTLQLDDDGRTFRGIARTPTQRVTVRWDRQN